MGLLYCFLTVTLRANQNVTGLAMTTFGVGFGNFFGGSLIKLSGSDVRRSRYLRRADISANRSRLQENSAGSGSILFLWISGLRGDSDRDHLRVCIEAHAHRTASARGR